MGDANDLFMLRPVKVTVRRNYLCNSLRRHQARLTAGLRPRLAFVAERRAFRRSVWEVSMDDNRFTMRYVILDSRDCDTIEAALGSDHGLVKRLKEQFIDNAEEARYRAAAQSEATDELQVDHNAVVSIGEDGAFVMSWMWIEDDSEDDGDEAGA